MNKKTTLGRKPALSAKQQRHILRLSGTKNVSLKKLAAMYGVSQMTILSQMTIYRIIKRSLDATPEQAVSNEATTQQHTHNIHPRIYSSYG